MARSCGHWNEEIGTVSEQRAGANALIEQVIALIDRLIETSDT
jgi:hypothetical protein